MKKSTKFLLICSSVILVIMIGLATYFLKTTNKNTQNKKENQVTQNVDTNDDKQKALDTITNAMTELAEDNTKRNLEERIKALDVKNNTIESVVKDIKKLNDYIHFPTEMSNDLDKRMTIQALMSLAQLMKEGKNDKFLPVSVDKNKILYDEKTNIIYVPISQFLNVNMYYYLELVKVEDKWKISPYTLIQSINIANTIQEQFERQKQKEEKK